jgi:hypothetical protein
MDELDYCFHNYTYYYGVTDQFICVSRYRKIIYSFPGMEVTDHCDQTAQ